MRGSQEEVNQIEESWKMNKEWHVDQVDQQKWTITFGCFQLYSFITSKAIFAIFLIFFQRETARFTRVQVIYILATYEMWNQFWESCVKLQIHKCPIKKHKTGGAPPSAILFPHLWNTVVSRTNYAPSFPDCPHTFLNSNWDFQRKGDLQLCNFHFILQTNRKS